MSDCEFAISNAEAFMEVLARDLSLLDGENVQVVLSSEKQVDALMDQLETAIQEADKIEQRLDGYDEILCHVRDTMEKMERKNSMIGVVNNNNIKLLGEIENLVVSSLVGCPKRYLICFQTCNNLYIRCLIVFYGTMKSKARSNCYLVFLHFPQTLKKLVEIGPPTNKLLMFA